MIRKLIIDRQSVIDLLIADYKYYGIEFINIDVNDRYNNYFHELTEDELIDYLYSALNRNGTAITEIEIVEDKNV